MDNASTDISSVADVAALLAIFGTSATLAAMAAVIDDGVIAYCGGKSPAV